MSFVATSQLSSVTRSISPAIALITSTFPALPLFNRRFISNDRPINPKIKITLEQLRMAARGAGRRLPICHDEHMKVMNALEAAKYENAAIYKYVKEYDLCREEYDRKNSGRKKSTLQELNKYVIKKRK
eukprot:CAMPEP_0171351766 /NCGR_PEP_ID=MMETSP0878-20121228/39921_1 /TAXON_ID=67004 /ORGANISM="Thalassiosira weissflogii, Strain CCMP1336" /LENGTH=128 /DNA_ID=CAMNT_0011857175 /DNA_START=169 /DNA_END=555 /DNA_ORIENTATION=+